MEEKNELDKVDEVMLPGFRFHPTDEELVGFYLRRKIQQKPLSIELIKQLDIYKYDPWDLPKMATIGEKEWYFYCPRDRKYRNSVRPNRVTSAGFWKATGTDRPIHSSEGANCIGLKKSLVFYKGRAAKGVKTDWMMHEFRLPSINNSSISKRPFDNNFIPANEAWAICRIFKKTNASVQRPIHHSWGNSLEEDACIHKASLPYVINVGCSSGLEQHTTAEPYPSMDVTAFNPINLMSCKQFEKTASVVFSPPPPETAIDSSSSVDLTSMLFNLSSAVFQDLDKPNPSIEFEQRSFPSEGNKNFEAEEAEEEEEDMMGKRIASNLIASNTQRGSMRTMNFPFNMMIQNPSEDWKFSLPWDII